MQYIPTEKIFITIDGIEYHGSFRVVGNILEVNTEAKTKKTQLGNSDPSTLAKIILSEMVKNNEYKI